MPVTTLVPSSDGVQAALHDHGGDGPPLLFCHATGLHGRVWDPVIEHLAGRFRCLAVDVRGHGDAVAPSDVSFDWGHIADDVAAVLDRLGLPPGVAAVGHSMGGAVLLLVEQRRPGTFASAWLFEPIVVDAPTWPTGPNPLAEGARRRREIFADRDEAYERYASKPPFAGCHPDSLRAYVDHGFADLDDGTVVLKCRGASEAATFEHSASVDIAAGLGEVHTRVTVAGSGDGGPPAQIAPTVAGALPNGRFESWPDHTHFAPLEAPDEVAAAIVAAVG